MVFDIVDELNPRAPVQIAAVALVLENTKDCPLQIGLLEVKIGEGTGFNTIEPVAIEVQLKAVPITVYCVVASGLSVKVVPVLLSGVNGFHVYVTPPLADIRPVSSGQIELDETVSVGLGTKSTEMVLETVHVFASVLLTVKI
jgi:hypothetical protein